MDGDILIPGQLESTAYTVDRIRSDHLARRANAPGYRGRRIREVDRRELTIAQQVTVINIVGIPVDPRDTAAIIDPARIGVRRAGIVERSELAACQLERMRRAVDRVEADDIPGLVDGPGCGLGGPREVDGRVGSALPNGCRRNAQRNAECARVEFPLSFHVFYSLLFQQTFS